MKQKTSPTESEITRTIKCSKNIFSFCECMKYDSSHNRNEFRPTRYEIILLRKFVTAANFPTRPNVIAVSPRQTGRSTALAVYALWYAIFNSDKTVIITSPKLEVSRVVLDQIRKFYNSLTIVKPGFRNKNKDELFLWNGTRIMVTACQPYSMVLGRKIDLLLIDDADIIPQRHFDDFITCIFPTMVGSVNTQTIITASTEILKNTSFNTLLSQANAGLNSFIPAELD